MVLRERAVGWRLTNTRTYEKIFWSLEFDTLKVQHCVWQNLLENDICRHGDNDSGWTFCAPMVLIKATSEHYRVVVASQPFRHDECTGELIGTCSRPATHSVGGVSGGVFLYVCAERVFECYSCVSKKQWVNKLVIKVDNRLNNWCAKYGGLWWRR